MTGDFDTFNVSGIKYTFRYRQNEIWLRFEN